jgi:choice-of-anchor B domain-containing protein
MKKIALLTLFLFTACTKELSVVEEQTDTASSTIVEEPLPIVSKRLPCEDGKAGSYPCWGYDLLAHLPPASFGSSYANDNWGWTDTETGKEYVLVGLDDGTAFVDISDPENPLFIGKLLTATSNSPWRDIKVFQNHAFIVSEAQNHGLQVFDLTRLRGLSEVQNFNEDARLTDFGNAHNIWINETSGFAYVFGSNLYQGGPVFINISDPKSPEMIGGYAEDSYTHDAQIVTYQGPDSTYQGRELLFGSNSDGGENNQLIIVDVTDKAQPQKIQSITYTNGGYTHQGILSEDHKYFFLGDELDELRYGAPTQTRIFDLSSLTNPVEHFNYFATTNAIDHNGYIKNGLFYLASYTAGLRVLDMSQLEDKLLEEIGFFDTYPLDDNPKFNGVWNVYPFFGSGVVAINDIDSGLFLVKASE